MTDLPLPPPFSESPRPRRILIIGGGVAGLATLKALVEEDGVTEKGPFDTVDLIERRDNIGGVWYLNDEVVEQERSYSGGIASGHWPIPARTAKHTCNGFHREVDGASSSASKPYWPSPAYPRLRGNVLPRFLSLSGGAPFPDLSHRADPFPSLVETQEYLEEVSKPLRKHIRCNIECIDVRELPGDTDPTTTNTWAVRVRDWNEDGGPYRTEYYDAIVVAIGWTDRPVFPRLEGLHEATQAKVVEHCKWYRGPESYPATMRVLVVGNGNSGNDVCTQVASRRRKGVHEPVYRVARHKAWYFYVSLPDPMIIDVPPIEKILMCADGRKADVHLNDGTILHAVDRIIFASGYEIGKFPFVHLLNRQPTSDERQRLPKQQSVGDPDWEAHTQDIRPSSARDSLWRPVSEPPPGTSFDTQSNFERVPQLYYHVLHARAGTLAFINLSVTSIPFWTSDMQAHLLRAIWDGSLNLPKTLEERLEYETTRLRWLADLKQSEPERVQAAQKQYIEEQKSNDGKYVPPEHTGVPPYHVLGTIVDDYGHALRSLAVAAKPQWATKLPEWSQHSKERNAMYQVKRATLEKARADRTNKVELQV